MHYEVRLADRIENTGLDCHVFATKDEADRAANMVREEYSANECECQVVETSAPATINFAQWNESGW